MIHETSAGISYSDDEQVTLGKFVKNYPKYNYQIIYHHYQMDVLKNVFHYDQFNYHLNYNLLEIIVFKSALLMAH